MLTIEDLQQQHLILFEALSGSRAYGLATPDSDTDIKGIYYLPRDHYYGLHYSPQISNASNDITYYELGRFIELLLQSNPSALELLASPPDCIRIRHPLMNHLSLDWFISQQCQHSFAGYAYGQIKKARGRNKKITNPMSDTKKTPLDYCYIIDRSHSIPLTHWLQHQQLDQHTLGLKKIPHTRELYALYHDPQQLHNYRGILANPTATTLRLSTIPADATPLALMSYNQDGYSHYCREYTAYQQWQRERNPKRYHNNQYDTKNMMHTIRLLETALDIARYGEIRLHRPNRDDLLAIKHGQYPYDTLLQRAENLMQTVAHAFQQSILPADINRDAALNALVHIRTQLYHGTTR